MDKILEKVMNFINENTMLLILICIFLIIILVIYLIDNTIKTKRLEKEELEKKNNPEPTVLQNDIPNNTIEEPKVEEAPVVQVQEPVVETPVVPVVEEPVVEEKVVEPPKVEEIPAEPVAPIIDSNIDELLNKDYSANNKVVENISNEPVVEPPKSKYNNDKKLSDIFGKKTETTTKKLETTQDFSDELDRILKKLNNEESRIEEESNNYTNMF